MSWCEDRSDGVSVGVVQQIIDIRRTNDSAIAHESLVIGLDAVVVVQIVDHDAEGFLERTRRGVAEPIDALEPRAVAEVKARHRVNAYRGLPRQIAGAEPEQGNAQLLALRRIIPPGVALQLRQRRGIGIASVHRPIIEPLPKSRYRGQGGKTLQLRKFRLEL